MRFVALLAAALAAVPAVGQSFNFNSNTGELSIVGLGPDLPDPAWKERLGLQFFGGEIWGLVSSGTDPGSPIGFRLNAPVEDVQSINVTSFDAHTELNLRGIAGFDGPVVVDLGYGVDTILGRDGVPGLLEAGLPGDFNGDGLVDVSDDILGDEVFAPEEYWPQARADWVNNFGRTSDNGPIVPEPAAFLVCLMAVAAIAAAGMRTSLG